MTQPNDDPFPTRPSLLRRLKDVTDQASWQEFNDIYAKLIRGFAIKAGLTQDEAHEVVQETFISAAKHLPQFQYDPAKCSFKTWLLNLSHWRVQRQLRKRNAPSAPRQSGSARHPEDDETQTATVERMADPAGPELEALWDQEWHATLLEAAFRRVKTQVDSKQWQIFDLYVVKEASASEVAATLEVSVGRVYLAKYRVSALVKKEIKRIEQASQFSFPDPL